MALSNWDTWAINKEGKFVIGSYKYNNIQVQIYKNWLYVYKKEQKHPFASIKSGNLAIEDISIYAIRGPQEGIYAAIWSGYEHENTLDGILMAGVYGFNEYGKWIGIQKTSLEWFKEQLNTLDIYAEIPESLKTFIIEDTLHYNQGDAYFANAFNKDIPSNKIGQATEPIILQGLKNDTINNLS